LKKEKKTKPKSENRKKSLLLPSLTTSTPHRCSCLLLPGSMPSS
jgi:hypothetical protein